MGTGDAPWRALKAPQTQLRCGSHLPRRLIGAETQQRRDVAGTIQSVVFLGVKQFNVAADGDGDDGIADVGQFARGISASHAELDEMGVEVAAVSALDGSRRIVFAEEEALHGPGLQRLQDPAKSGHTAAIGLSEVEGFVDFCGGSFLDPLLEDGAGMIADFFIRNTGDVSREAANQTLFDVSMKMRFETGAVGNLEA